MKTLNDLFFHQLQDIHSAEKQITQALPKFIDRSTSRELKSALEKHLEEAENEVETLSNMCREFSIDPDGKHCVGIEGIIEEGLSLLTDNPSTMLLDIAIIGALQKVEHYEITSYATAANYAQELGYTDAQDILYQIMQEEKAADEMMTAIAEQLIGNVLDQDIIEATT